MQQGIKHTKLLFEEEHGPKLDVSIMLIATLYGIKPMIWSHVM